MQPKAETAGDPGTKRAAGAAVAAGPPEGRPNGGASAELHDLLGALQAMRVGDFSVRMAGSQVGLLGKIADTFNEIVASSASMAIELEQVGQTVGIEGKTRRRARFRIICPAPTPTPPPAPAAWPAANTRHARRCGRTHTCPHAA